jgi:hypothetical protein
VSPDSDGAYCHGSWVDWPEWTGLTVAAMACAVLGALFGVAGLAFMVAFWGRPVVRMSQPAFLVLFSVAVVTLNAGVMVLVANRTRPSQASCASSSALMALSLTFMISSLGVKEWRAWKVRLHSLAFRRLKVGNRVLYGYIGLAVAIQVAILTSWFVTSPPQPDPCAAFTCSTGGAFATVSIAYVLVLILLTTGMAFIARDVPSVGGEAGAILHVSLFFVFALIFLAVIMSLGMGITPDLQVWLIAFCIMWISAIYVVLIIFRKLKWIEHSREEINELFLSVTPSVSSAAAARSRPASTRNSEAVLSNKGSKTWATSEEPQERSQQESRPPSAPHSPLSSGTAEPLGGRRARTANEAVARVLEPASPLSTRSLSAGDIDMGAVEFHGFTAAGAVGGASLPVDQPAASEPDDLVALRCREGFKIAEKDGWNEYVDRETGESFWVQPISRELRSTPPDSPGTGAGALTLV